MDILEKLDDEYLNELWKKVIRKGALKRKLICPAAIMKAQGGKCVTMSPEERRKRKKATKITGRKVSANLGVQKKAMRKRAKSMKKRAMRIPSQGAADVKFTEESTSIEYINILTGE